MNSTSLQPVHPVRRFLIDLKSVLVGTDQDYTTGSMGRAIALLAIPMVLEMVMESVFALVDVYFASKLGADAVAVIGLTESVLTLIFALAIGLSMGATAMVARRVGEKDGAAARVAAVQAIYLGLLMSLPISLIGILFPAQILELMGASTQVVEMGYLNTAVMLGGNITIMWLFLINAVFRGAGQPAVAMVVLTISNIINIVLDPCLMFGWGPFPEMGITGAAVATNIGRGTAVVLQLALLVRGFGVIKLGLADLKPDLAVMWRLLKVSFGGIIQFIIATSSWMFLFRIMAVFGSVALAGYTIAIRIFIFALLPAWGLANAAATLVGQNLGAKQPERAEKSVKITALANMIFLGVIGVFFLFVDQQVIGFFTQDPQTIAIGSECLRIMSFSYSLIALGLVAANAFNGSGDTWTPTLANFLAYWLLQIPLSWLLALKMELGPVGVFTAITISETFFGLLCYALFRRGRWKTREI